jgi:hypothetical protein
VVNLLHHEEFFVPEVAKQIQHIMLWDLRTSTGLYN